jgi:hypothetical protein
LFTISAIIAAGGWFIWQSASHPKLKIDHRISHRTSARNPQKDVLLAIDVLLSNVGNVPIRLDCGHLKVFDINPGEQRLLWSPPGGCLPSMTIEPGEGDQVHEEITIGSEVQTVRMRSFFTNSQAKARGDGWEYISLYDLQKEPAESQTTTPQPAATGSPSGIK